MADVDYEISSRYKIRTRFYLQDWTTVRYYEGVDIRRNTIYTVGTAGIIGLGASVVANLATGAQPVDIIKKRYTGDEIERDSMETEDEFLLPDLPEEDDPSVSLNIYKPFNSLINAKGAVVNLQLNISGG